MRNDFNWDDLGRSIEDAVNWAVNSRDYHKLNQTIRQVVETAVDVGGEAVRRAAEKARPQTTEVRCLYGNHSGIWTGGVLKNVFGGILTGFSALGVLGSMVLGALEAGFFLGVIPFAVGLAAGCGLLASGISNIRFVRRFAAYKRLLGTRTTCAIDKLARAVGKSAQFVREDLRRMIGKGLFLEGHLDHEQTMLITSDETYREFEQARVQLEQAKHHQAAEAAKAPDPNVREVLDRGSAFIAQIRKCNDDIPGEAVSAKIDRMELIVRRIFDRVRTNPEVIPDLKKLMDYYLPMTVKLLNAYAEMDAQPIQNGTIESSKREIEGTLDTLNRAFEKLLDELFQDTAMDISSDITVLQTLLAQEGLTDDELTKIKENAT